MAKIASTGKDRSWALAARRVMDVAWWGHTQEQTAVEQPPDVLNGEYLQSVNAAGTGVTPLLGSDANDVVTLAPNATPGTPIRIGSGFVSPGMAKAVSYNMQNNASIGTTTFFVADGAYTVLGVSYCHKTQGTGTIAVNVTKDPSGTAAGAGNTIQTGSFDAVAIVNNTVTAGVLTATAADLSLVKGDSLSVKFTGSVTTLAGVVVTVWLSPQGRTETSQYFCRTNADTKTQTFFIANRDMVVTGVQARYATAFAGGVTIDVVKDTTTGAAGAGTSVLTAAMAGDGTINTVITPTLSATPATLKLAAGDRLAVKFSATTTGTGVCITVSFASIYDREEVTWQLALNAQQQITQNFWIADRAYEVVDASCIFDVTAGGASKLLLTIDKGTSVPGAGNATQTDNTSAGFDLALTARTVQFATPAGLHLRLLSAGDRLGLNPTGAAQSTALVAITVSLRPRY